MEKLTSFIGGKWSAPTKKHLSVTHKYTGATIAEVSYAYEKEIEQAIATSSSAFSILKKWSAQKRSETLKSLSQLVDEHGETLAKIICAEAGKPLDYARGEITRCQTTLDLASQEALRMGGEVIPMDYAAGKGKSAYTKRFPLGPIFGVVPFNFPLNLAMHKLAPALAAGCSITLKPSPYTPLSLLYFARLIEQTDLPPGAVNIVVCENDMAEKLLTSEIFKLFSFTGSPTVGWALKNKAGKKKVQLELGGNAAVIVDESAELNQAIQTIATGGFLYSGQICISTQRIYLHEKIVDQFIEGFVAAVKNLKVGNPEEADTVVGPLIAREHCERIDEWVQEAIKKGATLLYGGEIVDREKSLFAPTILTNVPHDCRVYFEEVFGPVVVIESFNDFDHIVSVVNDSRYGLQAGLFTNRIDQMKEAFETIEVGGLMINNIPGFRVDSMPYGGIKDSGLGREGLKYAIDEMTEPRLLVY